MAEYVAGFAPDWISPPGDTIADLLEEYGWTQAELAKRTGYTLKHINLLINGKASITDETALRLERVLGSVAGFWLNREARYRERLARDAEEKRFNTWTSWLDRLPVRELMNAGAITKRRVDTAQKPFIVKDLLRFFGVASPDEWQTHYEQAQLSFRRTRPEQSDTGAISAWLRMGEITAEKTKIPKFDKSKFESSLREVRKLTILPPDDFEPQLRRYCSESGVIFVLVPSIPRAHVSGVARWYAQKTIIQLSLYGKTNDKFWFNFFHEAAHLLFHDKNDVFLDEFTGVSLDSPEEREANKWAGDFLIPPKWIPVLPSLKTRRAVCDFAERIGIHPGIVVGRLQHDEIIDLAWMNNLKVSFRFREEPVG